VTYSRLSHWPFSLHSHFSNGLFIDTFICHSNVWYISEETQATSFTFSTWSTTYHLIHSLRLLIQVSVIQSDCILSSHYFCIVLMHLRCLCFFSHGNGGHYSIWKYGAFYVFSIHSDGICIHSRLWSLIHIWLLHLCPVVTQCYSCTISFYSVLWYSFSAHFLIACSFCILMVFFWCCLCIFDKFSDLGDTLWHSTTFIVSLFPVDVLFLCIWAASFIIFSMYRHCICPIIREVLQWLHHSFSFRWYAFSVVHLMEISCCLLFDRGERKKREVRMAEAAIVQRSCQAICSRGS